MAYRMQCNGEEMPTPTDSRAREKDSTTLPFVLEPEVRLHQWKGFHFESRLVRAPKPRFPPVLLIGGAFQRKEQWGNLERGAIQHADVLTVDPPGWGNADLLPEHYGVEIIADCLHHMLGELGLRRLSVAAGSYGTAIAYHLAQMYPEDVERMVLIGSMSQIPDHARAAMLHTLDLLESREMDLFAQAMVDLLMTRKPDVNIVNGRSLRRILHKRFASVTADEIDKYCANTRRLLRQTMLDIASPPPQPVLVITGEHDTFTTPDLCRDMAACCADSQYAEVTDADHMVHLERGDELSELILHFCSELPITDLPCIRQICRIRGNDIVTNGGHITPTA
jgi:pimeloyl-ACP methyl ester carboxylesterase